MYNKFLYVHEYAKSHYKYNEMKNAWAKPLTFWNVAMELYKACLSWLCLWLQLLCSYRRQNFSFCSLLVVFCAVNKQQRRHISCSTGEWACDVHSQVCFNRQKVFLTHTWSWTAVSLGLVCLLLLMTSWKPPTKPKMMRFGWSALVHHNDPLSNFR